MDHIINSQPNMHKAIESNMQVNLIPHKEDFTQYQTGFTTQ
jgi:hypothetical protein